MRELNYREANIELKEFNYKETTIIDLYGNVLEINAYSDGSIVFSVTQDDTSVVDFEPEELIDALPVLREIVKRVETAKFEKETSLKPRKEAE